MTKYSQNIRQTNDSSEHRPEILKEWKYPARWTKQWTSPYPDGGRLRRATRKTLFYTRTVFQAKSNMREKLQNQIIRVIVVH